MMTKEEIASVVLYCKDNNVSFKSRLQELGITPWRFYEAKRSYANSNGNELLEIDNKGRFIACPDLKKKRTYTRRSVREALCSNINIELQSANGTIMRIHGELNNSQIESIILSATGHV
ncbi:hypothetical protein [Bacteroides thetaiotaomicron]|uniref:hypothetical protein n=1 Tax=Bacteroides thetaiotaomicron TaxID=818 RepID=UPI004064521C